MQLQQPGLLSLWLAGWRSCMHANDAARRGIVAATFIEVVECARPLLMHTRSACKLIRKEAVLRV
jgi:hypothetical protein